MARRHALTVLTAVLVAASIPGAGAAAAPRPGIKDLEQQLGKLNDKAEKATEAFNGGRVRLGRARAAKRRADADLRLSNRDLNRLLRQVRAIAATQYMSGGGGGDITVLMGDGPQQVIDRSTLLSHLDRNQAALLSSLTTAQKRSTKWSRDARAAAANAQRTATRLRGQKRDAQQAVDKVEAKLRELRREAAARNKPDPTKPKPSPSPSPSKPSSPSPAPSTSDKGAGAVAAAKTQLGKPYVWGADGPDSYDCSGLTMWAYNKVGITIPHYTVDQYNAAKSHPSYSQAKPGDLIFFGSDMHHVGMYIGGGKMVHAPHTGDVVRIADLAQEGYVAQISGLGRYA